MSKVQLLRLLNYVCHNLGNIELSIGIQIKYLKHIMNYFKIHVRNTISKNHLVSTVMVNIDHKENIYEV